MTFTVDHLGSDITLYCGDALEVLPTLPAGSVDCVVTDPPYGINYRHGASYSQEKRVGTRHVDTHIIGDDAPFNPAPFLHYKTVAMFGANHYASRLTDSRGWMVWNKRPGMRPGDFSDCELIWTNVDGHIKQYEYTWAGVCRAGEAGQVVLHPTQKPVALMAWILSELTHLNDTVFDPFMGSGTTGVACVQLGRKFIGIEIHEPYYQIAKKRISDAQLQMRLL